MSSSLPRLRMLAAAPVDVTGADFAAHITYHLCSTLFSGLLIRRAACQAKFMVGCNTPWFSCRKGVAMHANRRRRCDALRANRTTARSCGRWSGRREDWRGRLRGRLRCYGVGERSVTSWSLSAMWYSSASEAILILRMMLLRCTFTVASAMPMSPAICLFRRPWAT
jgi:hypothetical protein